MLHTMRWFGPHDPPFPCLGLPWVVGIEVDLAGLRAACDVRANSLAFCTGLLSVRPGNDLPGLTERFGARTYFVHPRATKRTENPRNFYKAAHLAGHVDLYAVVQAPGCDGLRRTAAGAENATLPQRPDHSHQLLDDLNTTKPTYPGYSASNTACAAP